MAISVRRLSVTFQSPIPFFKPASLTAGLDQTRGSRHPIPVFAVSSPGRRSVSVGILRAFLLSFLVLVRLALPDTARACGMTTHGEVCTRAAHYFSAAAFPEYKRMLLACPEALQAGSAFPDWGYAFGYPDASEEAHWPPFLEAFASRLLRGVPEPWDVETERLFVFFLGVVSHSVADIDWHGLAGVKEGFIDVMSRQEFGGDWGKAHDCADTGGDLVEGIERDLDWLAEAWYFPLEDVALLYRELGYPDITAEVLRPRTLMLFLGAVANQIGGALLYSIYAAQSPFLGEEFQDYLVGGLDSMALRTTWWWEDYIGLIREGRTSAAARFRPRGTDGVGGSSLDRRASALMSADAVAGRAHGLLDLSGSGLLRVGGSTGGWGPSPVSNGAAPVGVGGTAKGVAAAGEQAPSLAAAAQQGLRWRQEGLIEVEEEQTARGVLYRARIAAELGGRLPGNEPGIAAREREPEGRLPGNEPGIAAREREPEGYSRRNEPETGASGLEPDLRLSLAEPYSYLGRSLAAGDLNGDNVADLVVGSPGRVRNGRPQQGAAVVYYGGAGRGPHTFAAEHADLVIPGPEAFARFGWSVAVGDFNADGRADLAVGAPATGARSMRFAGKVFLYFGAGGPVGFASKPDVTISGDSIYCRFGWTLAAGDLNADGYRDLIVGAPYAPGGGEQRGLAAVFFARNTLVSGTLLTLGHADWLRRGAADYDWYGYSAGICKRAAGAPLLLVGAPGVVAGSAQAAGALYAYDAAAGPGKTPLFTLVGDRKFDKTGAAFTSGRFFGGDRALLALAAPTRAAGKRRQAGQLFLVDPAGLAGRLTVAETAVGRFRGNQDFSRFGWRPAAGDFNGDGADDLLITQPWFNSLSSGLMAGQALLWKGGPRFNPSEQAPETAAVQLPGPGEQARFGDAALLADFNGDGYDDLVVAASRDSREARHGGSVSVYWGQADPGACFVATVSLGGQDEGKLRVLREFRDRRLMTSAWGRDLVQAYYRTGPGLAGFLAAHEKLRGLMRLLLMPLVGLCSLWV